MSFASITRSPTNVDRGVICRAKQSPKELRRLLSRLDDGPGKVGARIGGAAGGSKAARERRRDRRELHRGGKWTQRGSAATNACVARMSSPSRRSCDRKARPPVSKRAFYS